MSEFRGIYWLGKKPKLPTCSTPRSVHLQHPPSPPYHDFPHPSLASTANASLYMNLDAVGDSASPLDGAASPVDINLVSNGTVAHTNGHSHPDRNSQETLRRERFDNDDPGSVIPELAPVQLLSQSIRRSNGYVNPPPDGDTIGSPASPSPEQSGSYSPESTVEPTERRRRHSSNPAEDDEDVWEDEEDSILMDEHGNIIYEGPDYQDSASDFSDGADEEELNKHRRSYREANQQYCKSRRALLLSGLSSFASSPSSENLGSASPTVRHDASASPSSSIYEREHPSESYYQPDTTEPVDNADAGGRTDGLRYDSDSDKQAMHIDRSTDSRHSSASRVKSEPRLSFDEDTKPLHDEQHSQTPKGAASDVLSVASNGEGHERLARPPPSPRTRSSLTDIHPSTPSPLHRGGSELSGAGDKEGRSQGGLAPSLLIFDQDMHDPSEAYMTPRLSPTTLHEEPKYSISSNGQEKQMREDEEKKTTQPRSTVAATASRLDTRPFSLWDYLKEEVLATDFDATQEMKWERVTNFISIPFWMEKIIMFGFVVCLDSFLYTFTILPLRFGVAMWTWIGNSARWILGGQKRYLQSSQKCDILKMLLIVLSCVILSRITDASKMYHSVRGQDVVKLSVIFNVLEIADRLCCSFGQDLLDSLFSRSTLARRKNGKQPYLRPIGFFLLSLCYVLAHTLVLFYQLVTLNVAINSYDNALLTLLLSNQFVEIKSSVFKKFEKENVFQMTCADIVERFQLTLMLSAIGLRNLIELSGGSLEPSSSPLPTSFTVFPSLSLLETVLTPVCIVLASECIVDWLKHAFITKFNHIRPAVYGRFMDVLCRDLVVGGPSTKENSRKHTFVDQSPIISRRLGFAALPLACLLVRLILQIIGMIGDTSHIDECIAPVNPRETGWIGVVAGKLGAADIGNDWVRAMDLFVRRSAWALTAVIAWTFLVAIKLLLGTNLVSFASHRYATMHERENEENLNSKDRAPIGTNKDERSYDKSLGHFIDKPDYDAIQIKLDGTHVLPPAKDRAEKAKAGGGEAKVKKETSLMEVSRYNMVRSRIW
ncbi:uncharacterized protein UBRO2_02283 [Ustilago bromivora]|uniref:DUF747-domain-containing protein n=2 Tax=Ustilago bromivora TaxID=307758 RepID=A0A8H8QKL8_9BASI|nr:uncharacterized protein UBRO2_02283 [Ustilago bromivora]